MSRPSSPNLLLNLSTALKAAAAAAVAWLVVLPWGGVADDYPYYAPLGAVVAVSGTVVGSVRDSLQVVAAILSGALLAGATLALPLPQVVGLALAVAAGSLLSGWAAYGDEGRWVPISALFVLVLGGADAPGFVLAYAGLTAVGAAVGVAANLLLPPLPLAQAQVAVRRQRQALAGQVADLADGLIRDELPTHAEWGSLQRALEPGAVTAESAVRVALESRRVNWRAPAWRSTAERLQRQALALRRLTFVVEDVVMVVTEQENADLSEVALGSTLRLPTAVALRETAGVLVADGDPTAEELERAKEAVRDLAASVRAEGGDPFAAGAVVTALRQILAAVGRGA